MSHWKFIKGYNVSNIDGFVSLVFMNYCHTIVVAINADVSNVLFQLDWTYFNRLLLLDKIADLNIGGKMTFFDEFSQGNSDPLSFFWYKDLSIFSMLSPSSPFSLHFGLNIIEEDSSGCCTHGIVVRFIAHNDDIIFRFKPCYFLDKYGFNNMLLFLWSSNLSDKILDCC